MDESTKSTPVVGVERADSIRSTLRLTSQGKIVGQHPSIREVVSTVERVASSSCTVLITGESGTGKELVVAALHDASLRARGPVVTVDCSAIHENLIEAKLFGHVKGAYTGAVTSNPGLVATAEGGTLFLDEVGELPLLMQVKLLRLLQQREYIPVGDTRTVHCDIRVVAATNRDLEAEVAAGRFREDLYYRINVVHVHLPPLRDRREDIELLAMHFLKMVTARNGRSTPTGIDQRAMRALREYDWRGNIRELENAIERAVLLAPSALVTLNNLPPRLRDGVAGLASPSPPLSTQWAMPPAASTVGPLLRAMIPDEPPLCEPPPSEPPPGAFAPPVLPEEGVDLAAVVEALETSLIRQALARTGGNRNRAAQLLRVNRTTLIEKIRRKRIEV